LAVHGLERAQALPPVKILCAHCGDFLGTVGASAAQMNPHPVWRIEPGWDWQMVSSERGVPKGVLARIDQDFRQHGRLIHATWGRTDSRVGVSREAPLPIVVRCPKCHSLRLVQPDAVLRPAVIR